MAKSKNFFGLRQGSTKSHTYQVLRGEQITKDRVYHVANPQSDLQMQQRVLLPMVSNARSVLKSLVNHSFEGINYGDDSLRYFSSQNLKKDALNVTEYVYSGISDTGLADFQISKGSLTPWGKIVPWDYETGGPLDNLTTSPVWLQIKGDADVTDISSKIANLPDELNSDWLSLLAKLFGYPQGSQLTFLAVGTGEDYNYSDDGLGGHYHKYVISRLYLDETIHNNDFKILRLGGGASFTGVSLFNDYFRILIPLTTFNPDTPTASSPGQMQGHIILRQQTTADTTTENIEAIAVIVSQLVDNTWKRSTERLQVMTSLKAPTYKQVLSSYLKSSTVTSDKYLNNGNESVSITGGSVALN